MGNGSFANFLAAILSILSTLALAKIGADFGDTPDQAQSGPINWDQAQPDTIRPNLAQSGVDFGDAPN